MDSKGVKMKCNGRSVMTFKCEKGKARDREGREGERKGDGEGKEGEAREKRNEK